MTFEFGDDAHKGPEFLAYQLWVHGERKAIEDIRQEDISCRFVARERYSMKYQKF